MRHPVRDRLVMLLYALLSFGAAGLSLYMAFAKTEQAEIVRTGITSISPLPLRTMILCVIAVAVVLILLGAALISAILPQKKTRSSNFAIQQNENGTVRISLKAIDALVTKCLSQHDEIKVVTSSLYSDEETVCVDVHVALLADISMPLAISSLQKQITRYVEACTGVNVKEVRIFVDGTIAKAEAAQQSPFAIPASILNGDSEPVAALDEASEPVQEEAEQMEEAAPSEEVLCDETLSEAESNEEAQSEEGMLTDIG